jgi:hypothetical protein
VFYVDVGNIPPKDVEGYMQNARDKLKEAYQWCQRQWTMLTYVIIPNLYWKISLFQFVVIAAVGLKPLPGGENAAAIEDIQYLQNKLFISLGVPKSYLTAEEDLSGKSTLAQEDIKFARTIQRIQKIVVSELAKISLIHLYLRGYDESAIYNFDLR